MSAAEIICKGVLGSTAVHFAMANVEISYDSCLQERGCEKVLFLMGSIQKERNFHPAVLSHITCHVPGGIHYPVSDKGGNMWV